MVTPSLEDRIAEYAGEHIRLLAHARVVLAVSGGADSAAMVGLLCESGAVDAGRAVLAHFDHGLRGSEDSEADREVVQALCGRYGIDLRIGRWERPERGEAAARAARYGFLAGVAREIGAAAIATGHTADDQVETVLMNVMRGAGLAGVAGMAPRVGVSGGAEHRARAAAAHGGARRDARVLRLRAISRFTTMHRTTTCGTCEIASGMGSCPRWSQRAPGHVRKLLRLAASARASIVRLDIEVDGVVRRACETGAADLSREALRRLRGCHDAARVPARR